MIHCELLAKIPKAQQQTANNKINVLYTWRFFVKYTPINNCKWES